MPKHVIIAATAAFALVGGAALAAEPAATSSQPAAQTAQGTHAKKMAKNEKKGEQPQAPAPEQKK